MDSRSQDFASNLRLHHPAERPLPRRLGRWVLERVIGEGAAATIYRARPASGADASARYAVKVLDRRIDRPLALAFFRREAEVGRRIQHPHLVPVLTSQLSEPPYYLVMPHLLGRTVAERIHDGEQFALPHALWIARQAAEALAAIHAGGYMHGDVKPGNILVSPQGHATLIDLGFARELAESGGALDRPILGTINYLAPELLTSSLGADARSDLYSLGATLYELLTWRPPIQATSLEELAEKQRHESIPDIRSLVPQIPIDVAELLRRLMAREPLRRPQSAGEVVKTLVALEIGTLAERVPA
jgi:eukaryotic-like serine/threonine-protein kinase